MNLFQDYLYEKAKQAGWLYGLGGATMRHCWAIIYVRDLLLPGSIISSKGSHAGQSRPSVFLCAAFVTVCFPGLGKPSPCLPLSYAGTMEGSTTLTSLIHDYCGRYHYFPFCGVEFEWFLKKSSSARKLFTSVENGVSSFAFISYPRWFFGTLMEFYRRFDRALKSK